MLPSSIGATIPAVLPTHIYKAALPMSLDQAKTAISPDPRIGACVYLLHGLLQRLEQHQPGLIGSMTEGALDDRAAIDAKESVSAAQGHQILEEALRMLRLMSEQLKLAREQL